KVTEQIAGELAINGYTVVSGFARGIDTIAHRACLKAGGRTIAVLGSGIDVVYPSENAGLYKEVIQNGAVISEFAVGTGPHAVNFPRRNRIISGLCAGVLVVQAAEKSGSLITAEFALEQNREVFAVPGNIGSKLSKGTNRLIKKGAKLVNTIDDILEEIEGITGKRKEPPGTKEVDIESLEKSERVVYESLRGGQMHVDQIIKSTGFSSSEVLANLLNL
ncbi:MAG: DNA-protecting protein DprA, partial [Candidatus Dadabacteria bacterium]|nr:DNA-protecting protein DprA [Candidatus Dadabacteria bacterium]NIS08318.1 DNA-protecting protein DprA [Candidatus Dadabacteria bacterium]NIS38168.1 DNA-protecting protein DprA [Candidatus Saccharibacteria bacterium]NIV41697.1 DNA-protecting protein DprA [Candidatus Dadabacteria bacterium]NIY21835.1 DNA-protecting protein DprA [Candidatus Dadabacteria bacterium]